MAEGDIPEGFRKTEAGVIPKGWEVRSLGTLGSWKGGMTPSMSNSSFWENGNIPWISSGDVKSSIIRETASRVTKKSINEGRTTLLPKHSVIVVMRSGILRKYLPVAITSDPMAINQDIKALLPASGIAPYFVLHSIIHFGDRILAECLKTGTTVESIEYPWLKKFPIPFPLFDEQCAIATALSDVDALIAGLDQLIAKKRALKQAAMQQLLTGKKRLPGFQGKWERKLLGDHVTFLRNGVNSRSELQADGQIRYLHYGDIHACQSVFLSPITLPCLPSHKALALDRLCDGDLIFADASEDLAGVTKSVELRAVDGFDLVSGLHTIAARFDKQILADGFKGYLQFCPEFSQHLRRFASGTKVLATNRAHIATVEIDLPGVDEQVAIATILSDMDSELAALEKRRDKTRLLKQGMMQQLLTGRIRLVESAAHPSSQPVKPRTKSLTTG